MKIKNILEANICAFGQTLFDMFSLEDDEFYRALDSYLNDSNFDDMIKEYAYEFEYDMIDLENQANNCNYKNKEWDYIDIMNCSRIAFVKTITDDKTIEVEAFIDNILNEFNKLNK